MPTQDFPKKKLYNGILIGVPTFGMVSINFAINQATVGAPIFTSKGYMPVIEKPVDVARNEIVEVAREHDYGYVWFRDDDVTTPNDALVKLFSRLSPKQRSDPKNIAEAVVGGVVYSKLRPPTPMIFKENIVGGYEDWNYEDLVECDVIGMGATLIPVGVFNKIREIVTEYQCINHTCPVKWEAVYPKEQEFCPHCSVKLLPVFFKTNHAASLDKDKIPIQMTEDTYFCYLAKRVGAKIYADCGVQCEHEDTDTGTIFYYHKDMGIPVWEDDRGVHIWPNTDEKKDEITHVFKPKSNGKKNGLVKFNLGSGGVNKKGYINVDMTTDCDFRADIRDLRPVVAEYGQADEIYSSHSLEHVNRMAVTTTVKNWLKALKPGGKLEIIVPDAIVAMKEFIEADKNGTPLEDYDFKEAVVYGAQRYPADEHRTAITENKMKKVIASCSNMIEKSSIKRGRRKGANQDEIVVRVTKKKEVPAK